MMSTDTSVWKETLSQLQSDVQDNQDLIQQIRTQIALETERNKKEVQKLSAQAAKQQEELEELLRQVEGDDLFYLPSDKEAKDAFTQGLKERLGASRQVVVFAQNLLETPTASKEVLDKIRSGSTREANVSASDFDVAALSGNWIHYFQKDMFTCQSFWDDGDFKEYDFRGNKLVEDREGKYEIKDGQVVLHFSNGEEARYTVTGFSPDCLDYLIVDTPIRFDYIPAELLNSMLENQEPASAETAQA